MAHARFRGIRTSKKRKAGYVRFTNARESWSPRLPKITFPVLFLKAVLLLALFIPGGFVVGYAYYSNVYVPSLPASPSHDPFTLLYNGTMTDSKPTTFFKSTTTCTGVSPCPSISISQGDLIIFNGEVATQCGSVTDSLGNVWTNQKCLSITSADCATVGITLWTTISKTGGSDSIAFAGLGGNGADVQVYQAIQSLGSLVSASGTTSSSTLSITDSSSYIEYDSNALLVENNVGNCGTPAITYNSGQVARFGSGSFFRANTESKQTGTNAFSVTYSGGAGFTRFWFARIILPLHAGTVNLCPSGYSCVNAKETTSNFLDMNANSTVSSVALTNSPIDLSTVASKEILFFQSWENGSDVSGRPFGWYLTLNGTLPLGTNYTPLNDSSVALAIVVFPSTTSIGNTYVYMQRSVGQFLQSASGLGENPYANCPQSSTIYICSGITSVYQAAFQALTVALNFTANVNNSANNGGSALCLATLASLTGCNAGVTSVTPCGTGLSVCATSNFPWLSIQNSYHLGFWSQANQTGTIVFGTGNTGSFLARANAIYYWVPNTSTTNAQTDSGGFFGWVGRSLGGAWNAIGGTLGPIFSPILGLGNSILSVIISAIIQGINILITGAVTVASAALNVLQKTLNAIGQFIGWGAIGDQFFSFASGVVTYFTTGLNDALGWLLRLILRSIDLIKISNSWVNFYLNGLLNFLADGLNTIAEIVIFAQKVTLFLGSSYVLIIILFFLWYDADMGLAGWHAWFETMKWIAFISFDFLERMINFGISSITWLFGRIPTLDGSTLPELPTIAIGGGPIWPSTEMTALREGNFVAYFGQMIGVAFLVWFETSGLPGSIGANVPAASSSIGNMAPFLNIMLILIGVTGLLFVLNIPAKMTRGAFGLDDLKPNRLGNFSTGTPSIQTGRVSGQLVRKHPERKARIVINRGLGAGGLRPHLRRPQVQQKPSQQGVGGSGVG